MSCKRVVVAGASGFIGRAVAARLGQRFDVHGLSSSDMEYPETADSLVWLAQSRRYREFPEGAADMFAVNEAALFAALEWSRLRGVRRFVYASSGSVYAPSSGLLSEDAPVAPATFYAATKLNGEHLAARYSGLFEVIIARIFGVYGPGQAGMAMARVIGLAAAGQQVSLRGGIGLDFTPLYIDDAALILDSLLELPLESSSLVINLAGRERTTLADVAASAAAAAGREPIIVSEPGEPAQLVADTRRLTALMPGFEFHTLAAGVSATVAALDAA